MNDEYNEKMGDAIALIRSQNDKYVSCIKRAKELEESGNVEGAWAEYSIISETAEVKMMLGIADENDRFVLSKLEELEDIVHKRMMQRIDSNPFGRLTFGPYGFRTVCCTKMRDAIDNEEVEPLFEDGPASLGLSGRYYPDNVRFKKGHAERFRDDPDLDAAEDDVDTDDFFDSDICPFCGAVAEFIDGEE